MVVYANAVFKVPVSNPGSKQMFVRVDFTVQARLSLKLVSVVCYMTVIVIQIRSATVTIVYNLLVLLDSASQNQSDRTD